MKRFHLFLLISALVISPMFPAVVSQKKAAGDEAYSHKDYVKAAQIYEGILRDCPDPDVYYNLGNAYYRQNEIPKAVLNYKRALKLSPESEDARHNLELCGTKITDQFDKPQEMFFVTWTKNIVYGHTANHWGLWAIVSFALSLVFIGVYFFCSGITIKKVGFFSGIACLLFTALFHLFAYLQQQKTETTKEIVIMKNTTLYASPTTTSKKLRPLHEGTVVVVTDDFTKGWLQIEMPDGNQGWLPKRNIEFV